VENIKQKSDFSEKKYGELFNNSINGIAIHKMVYDSDNNPVNYILTDVNPMFESILHLKKGDVINKLATEVYRVEVPPYLEIYTKVAETLEPTTFTVFFEPMNKHFKVSAFSFEKGMFITAFDDITQQIQTIQKLKESEEKYRGILDNLDQGYYEVDLKGNYTFVNKYHANYLGLSKEELIGTNYSLFYDKEAEKRVFEKFNEVYKKNLPKGLIEVDTMGPNGNKRTFEALVYLKYDSNGNKIGFSGTVYDISERKKLERELAVLNEELEQKVNIRTNKLRESKEKYREAYNRAEFYKDLFAHDISNILQQILSAMELSNLLINNPENLKDIQSNFKIIKDQVNRGAKLISNVRKLSQLDEYEKSIKPIEIMNTIKNTITFIKDSYQERDIDIQMDSISKDVYIQANNLIRDVFENILINGVKHNINPKVEIIVRFSREVFEKIHYLKIEFVDNGVGIENARKDTIFLRAFNEDKSISGMGLGLSLVKKIIDSFNGKIWVEDNVKNDYSKGSNFIILLPLQI